MLGSLAKWLRILGYDTLFFNFAEDGFLKNLAEKEGRILLTKDNPLANSSSFAFLVEGKTVEEELISVCKEFSLKKLPVSRCSVCNGILKEVEKEEIKSLVPPYVFKTHNLFLRCEECGKIYWQGTHTEKIEKFLENIFKSL